MAEKRRKKHTGQVREVQHNATQKSRRNNEVRHSQVQNPRRSNEVRHSQVQNPHRSSEVQKIQKHNSYQDVAESRERKARIEKARKRRVRKKSGSRLKRVLTNLMLAICIIVFLVAAVQLLMIMNEYREGNAKNAEIQALAITIIETEDESEPESELPDYAKYVIDFDYLLSVNSDVIGWIRFDEPATINYPLLQGSTNDTYLRTDIDGDYSTMGCIFMEETNSGTYLDDNTIIYGHNMRDNSMFGTLSSYQDQEFYDQYPYFYIYTVDGIAMKFEIVAVSIIDAKEEYYTTSYSSDEAYQEYLDMVARLSQVETNLSATIDSTVVTLSTCSSNDDERLVVQGVCIEEIEMAELEE